MLAATLCYSFANHSPVLDDTITSQTSPRIVSRRGFHFIRTIQSRRCYNAPLKSEKALKECGRGAYDSVYEKERNLVLVRWYDNKCVTPVSTYVGTDPVEKVRRYDRSQKTHVQVDRLAIVGV